MIDVLFLDVDGVLNSEDYFYSIPVDQIRDNAYLQSHQEALKKLREYSRQ